MRLQQGIGILLILLGITLGYVLYAAITDINFSSLYISDGTSSGSLITQITTQDGQAPYIYTLVSGIGSEDNSLFFISGDSIGIHFTPDYLNPIDMGSTPNDNEYSVRIQSQDSTKISSFAYDYFSGLNNHGGGGNSDTEPNLYVYAGIKNDGSIIARGNSSYGGSGFPTDTGYVKIFPNSQAFAALKDDGSIRVRGNLLGGGAGGPTGTGYVKIFSNGQVFAALKNDGSITARGNSTAGSVGAPTDTGYIYISSTSSAFAALKDDGSIFTWGLVGAGGTGGPTGTGYVKIFSTISAFAALKDDGSIFTWGSSSYGGAGGPIGTGYVDIFSAGLGFSALKDDGSLFCWGGSYGSAPSGTGFEKVFVAVHAFAAIKDDSSVVARGYAGNGGIGAPTDTGYVKIFATNNAFAALKDDGSIFSWGGATYGGTGAPVDNGYISISSNAFAFAALKDDGSITVRGDVNNGGNGAPSGTGYTKIVSTQRSFIAIKNEISPYFRGNYSYGGYGLPSSFASIYVKNLFFIVTKDVDNDGIQDADDNCPLVYNSGQEDTHIATGTISFAKADYADWTLPENQDCITDNVCITRKDSQGIYNAITESRYDQIGYTSPDDTERAYGNCNNHSSLSFYTWSDAVWSDPTVFTVTGMVGKDMCLHLIQDDEYYDIVFTQWTPSAAGGGFAYTRSENIPAIGDACDCNDSLCTVGNDTNNNLICSPRDTACPIPPSGGGGGGGISTDDCPNGDYSPSYYDRICGSEKYNFLTGNIHGSDVSTGTSITLSDKKLTRKDVAIIMTLFATEKLGIHSGAKTSCRYTDIRKLSTGQQLTIQKGCQLGLIGLHQDGLTPLQKFRPNDYITRNEFITVLSRLLYDGKYNIPLTEKKNRYSLHIQMLQKNKLLPNIPKKITASFLLIILQIIQKNPSIIQR